jgi:RluA family pseudouridine synthase
MIIESVIVSNIKPKTKFIDYAKENIHEIPSNKGIRKAIERGYLLLNNKKVRTDTWLNEGDRIDLYQSNLYSGKVFNLKLDVLFEDDYLAVINKPAGFPVSGNKFKTITNSLSYNLQETNKADRLPKIHPVHRLDSLTSGLLICSKTIGASVKLGNMLKNREIEKHYQALVLGKTPNSGNIDFPIDMVDALSTFVKLDEIETIKFGTISLLKLSPKTGKTHQLRIHTAKSGFPILGDPIYPKDDDFVRYKGKGLFLCATELKFNHPITGKILDIQIDPPSKFMKYIERERRRWLKYNSRDEKM